jgi:hypothetical protein
MGELQTEFPFVEWGILVSKSAAGRNRFPSLEWISKIPNNFNISIHVCGRWVREMCEGNVDWYFELKDVLGGFNRIQLNFHGYTHRIKEKDFINGLKRIENLKFGRGRGKGDKQFIFQLDGVNDPLVDIAKTGGINAVPLFDLSGGEGRLPPFWPVSEGYCGYAGGLSPDNVVEQLGKIEKIVGKNPLGTNRKT